MQLTKRAERPRRRMTTIGQGVGGLFAMPSPKNSSVSGAAFMTKRAAEIARGDRVAVAGACKQCGVIDTVLVTVLPVVGAVVVEVAVAAGKAVGRRAGLRSVDEEVAHNVGIRRPRRLAAHLVGV